MKDAAVKAVPGVSEEMVGYSLLPDTMLTKQQIRWKANRIKDGTYALSAALPLASVERAKTGLRERLEAHSEYSIDLQRIIEDLCAGRAIREPKTTARHHYDMAVKAVEQGGRTVRCIEILREWFGRERYARDYEYLDANYSEQADRVVAFLATFPVEAGRSSAEPVTCIKELIDSLREGVRPEGGMQGEVELFDIDGANQIMDEAAEALSAIAHPGAGQPAAVTELVAELRTAAKEERDCAVEQDYWHSELLDKAAAALASGNDLRAENAVLKARVSELEGALAEAEETLRLAEHPAFPDPLYHDEVKRLGQRIGFGALMSTASAGWRETLAENKWPAGSEFVAGPCHGSVIHALKVVRATLSRTKKEPSDG